MAQSSRFAYTPAMPRRGSRAHAVASRQAREYSSAVGDARSAALSAESRIVLSKDQVSCDLAGEAAIVNLKNGVYYGLDPVGARIWNLMRQPVTFAQIVDSLLHDYAIDRLTLEADVRLFVNQLADQGLVEIGE
jgi:hypothetical protein